MTCFEYRRLETSNLHTSLSGSFEGAYIEVLDLNLRVLGKVVVLLCDEHALCKNMLELCSVN
jgi:hypothetical protein